MLFLLDNARRLRYISPHAASHPAPRHRPPDRPVPPGLLAAAGRAVFRAQSHPAGARSGRGVPPSDPGGDLPDRRGGPERDLPGARIFSPATRRARPKAARRGPQNLRPEAAADPRTGFGTGGPVALRPARGQAPEAQAPARPGAGGAAIRQTPSTQSARAAAPIVAARPPRRTATAPAAPGPHPSKKSPPEACEEARPCRSIIVTIPCSIGALNQSGRPIPT
jgi:hypothetical protein